MRIDLFLKKLCIVKSRSAAGRLCDEGKVTVNGRPAKSSKEVKVGDEIVLAQDRVETVFSVVALPEGNVSKAQAPSYYSVISRKQTEKTFQ